MNTDATKRFVTPNFAPLSSTSSIVGIWLSENEEVEWHYLKLNGEYFITGYTITIKPTSFEKGLDNGVKK